MEVAETRDRDASAPSAPVAAAPAPPATPAADAFVARGVAGGVARGTFVDPAGTGTVRGRVTDDAGRPLVQTSIRVLGTTLGTLTDDSGRFVVQGVRPGAARLNASRIGYSLGEIETTVARADTTDAATLVLRRQAVALEAVTTTDANARAFVRPPAVTAAGAAGCWTVRENPAWQRIGAPPLPNRLRLTREPAGAAGGVVEATAPTPSPWRRGSWTAEGDSLRLDLPAAGGDATLRLGKATRGWSGPGEWTASGAAQRAVPVWIVADRCP